MEHDGSEDGLTPNEQLVQVLEATALSEAWRVKWRGYLVFVLIVLWQLVPGAIGQAAMCLAVAAGMYWLLAVCDLMAAHWLGFLAKEHRAFRQEEPGVQLIAAALCSLTGGCETKSR